MGHLLCRLLTSASRSGASRLPQSRFRDTLQTSQGKFNHFPCTPAGSTTPTLDDYGLRDQPLARPAGYALSVSVRQVTGLLCASFRPSLAATPLRFATLHRHQVV